MSTATSHRMMSAVRASGAVRWRAMPLTPEQQRALGARIRDARTRLGWTQVALAARMGVQPATVYRWEAGRSVLSHSRLHHLADVLGLQVGIEPTVPAPAPAGRGEWELPMWQDRQRGTKALDQVKTLYWRTQAKTPEWRELEGLLDRLVPWGGEDWHRLHAAGADHLVVARGKRRKLKNGGVERRRGNAVRRRK